MAIKPGNMGTITLRRFYTYFWDGQVTLQLMPEKVTWLASVGCIQAPLWPSLHLVVVILTVYIATLYKTSSMISGHMYW